MKIERLSNGRVEDFLNYCRLHKGAVDSSFLYEDDLKQFQNTEENPAYLAIDENGKVKAAASLIMDEYAKRGRKSRFRIFHSEIEDIDVYKGLMDQLLKYKEGYDKYFIYHLIIRSCKVIYHNYNFQQNGIRLSFYEIIHRLRQ
ncbi:hypothetical protein NVV31_21410 [Cytobacillus firmus]|uniref:hypothetical protein n=1 Tax=Cytobacillus firmus TaxID=1399 RepID=UPI0021C58715|nr:hypothetical protein [Cytobacillus firmus]MCU1807952.1 hypothetical protein [Cytobacillus firmus]